MDWDPTIKKITTFWGHGTIKCFCTPFKQMNGHPPFNPKTKANTYVPQFYGSYAAVPVLHIDDRN
jgi:hypothetical protein